MYTSHCCLHTPLLLLSLLLLSPVLLHAQKCLNPAATSPPDLSKISPKLYYGQKKFAISMLQAIRKATPNENTFFSPYSTYHALLLAYFGANGATEQELKQVLHLDWAQNKADVRSGYRLEKQSRIARAHKMPLKFSSADRIYFDQHINLSTCLEMVLEQELIATNFRQDADKSRQNINSWIASITDNQIPEMLMPGDIDANTNVVLANAAYFKGQWASQFNAKNTKLEPFYISPSDATLVEMMHKKGSYVMSIDERIGAHILEIPYCTSENENDESTISMVIVLPPFVSNSLEDVLSKLKPETIKEALDEGMSREIEISLPKFEFEQRLELIPILRDMGISSIFTPQANFTDFSANENISFGDAKHVAKIKVDEEGSTAASATVLVSFRSARPIEPTKFVCNHPFLFLIYDKKTNAILFTGIYRNPK